MEVQAIIFSKKKWTATSARKWLKEHGYSPIKKAHGTEHYIRYRLRTPRTGDYITKKLGTSGIKLILMR